MTRMTCKQALDARYIVFGEDPRDNHTYGDSSLSFDEAFKLYHFLKKHGYNVIAKVERKTND